MTEILMEINSKINDLKFDKNIIFRGAYLTEIKIIGYFGGGIGGGPENNTVNYDYHLIAEVFNNGYIQSIDLKEVDYDLIMRKGRSKLFYKYIKKLIELRCIESRLLSKEN